jgi:hypothetical protein
MSERLGKFLLMLVVAPLLILLLAMLAVIVLFLPIVALIAPRVVKLRGEGYE